PVRKQAKRPSRRERWSLLSSQTPHVRRQPAPTGLARRDRTRGDHYRSPEVSPSAVEPAAVVSPRPEPPIEVTRQPEATPTITEAASFAAAQAGETTRRQQAEEGFGRALQQEQARRKQSDAEFE